MPCGRSRAAAPAVPAKERSSRCLGPGNRNEIRPSSASAGNAAAEGNAPEMGCCTLLRATLIVQLPRDTCKHGAVRGPCAGLL